MRTLSFDWNGSASQDGLITARARKAVVFLVVWAVAAIASPAQTFTSLHSFNFRDGGTPLAGLVQGTDGNFYGTTNVGGAGSNCFGACGTVFKITPKGALTTIYNFCTLADCNDGASPKAGLVQGTDGNFYGTTTAGGTGKFCTDGCGTVFKITPEGELTTLHSFNGTDGIFPEAGLVQGTEGSFYGTTIFGGTSNNCDGGCGTVFKITPQGELTTLHSFNGTDGDTPLAVLVQGTDGNFYGTTSDDDGTGKSGTVFKITPKGKLTTLHNFNGTDGRAPRAGLALGADGNFYGTTLFGGIGNNNCTFGCGTVFKITLKGKLTTLHRFNGADGDGPQAVLTQDTDGNFYGTTVNGGANLGTVFKITPEGKLTTLHNFCTQTNCPDGALPQVGVVQGTDGSFYGTAPVDGTRGHGTVFRLSVGLGPFVETRPTSGKVGAKVSILGTNLTGATGVSFNGTAATFAVASKSEVTTTVPAGATTGTVEVTTPKRTLKSNMVFRVTK